MIIGWITIQKNQDNHLNLTDHGLFDFYFLIWKIYLCIESYF